MSASVINRYIGAIDQGTSSTKFVVYDHQGHPVGTHQLEHKQLIPEPGLVEHNPLEIWENTVVCVKKALEAAGIDKSQLDAVGITNQRESTVVWNKKTGEPYYNVIVWNDTRTRDICDELKKESGIDRFRGLTGLPLATYFSASKLLWLLQNVKGLREAGEKGEALFGTLDSWLIYKLTGGELHITDVTNASRTQLMNIETLKWDKSILDALNIPVAMLPQIRSSSEVYTTATQGGLDGVRIAAILGDQQSALFGQTCFQAGQTKATYGTGAFLLMNTGASVIQSQSGLLTTVAFQLGKAAPVYALEGSVAYCGSVIQWLRDNLGIIEENKDSETLARVVPDNGGMYFVPAFSGLFAPYWRDDARGVLVGMTAFNNKNHLARAALEAAAFQVQEVLEAMQVDSGVHLSLLKVDGGMTENQLLMQFQADMLELPVLTPHTKETTSLGAAFAAGLAVGYWKNFEELRSLWHVGKKWDPYMSSVKRNQLIRDWDRAVQRTLGWIEADESVKGREDTVEVAARRRRALSVEGRPLAGLIGRVLLGAGLLAGGFALGLQYAHRFGGRR